MAKINFDQILKKTAKSIDSNRLVTQKKNEKVKLIAMRLGAEYADEIVNSVTSSHSDVPYNGGLGTTAISALTDISVSEPEQTGQCEMSVDICFEGDMHRESLVPVLYPGGVNNIAALLNNGYAASSIVYGIWRGHYENVPIYSLQHRAGAHFMNDAKTSFLIKHSGKYRRVDVELSSDYS